MSDLVRILPLWRELEALKADYVLATVVRVEGSSYRQPGARMLLASDGRRAGTVSGGCLEAEVARRAWWLTANGPVIERYSTAGEDANRLYASGCGGTVYLLLERRPTASPLLAALAEAFEQRVPCAVGTILEGPCLGQHAFVMQQLGDFQTGESKAARFDFGLDQVDSASLQAVTQSALEDEGSAQLEIPIAGRTAQSWIHFMPSRPGLWIFGAGDDAVPLHRMASELGWRLAVLDGRSDLAAGTRFPLADAVHVLPIKELPKSRETILPPWAAGLRSSDAAVIMTHSFEQDARILASLLTDNIEFAYLGVLGPQRRTRELLEEAAQLLDLPASPARAISDQLERWMARIHAPMGIDLGAESPATIALSILSEIQITFAKATARPLRDVRRTAKSLSSV